MPLGLPQGYLIWVHSTLIGKQRQGQGEQPLARDELTHVHPRRDARRLEARLQPDIERLHAPGELLTIEDSRPMPEGGWKDSKFKCVGGQWQRLLAHEVEVPEPKPLACGDESVSGHR